MEDYPAKNTRKLPAKTDYSDVKGKEKRRAVKEISTQSNNNPCENNKEGNDSCKAKEVHSVKKTSPPSGGIKVEDKKQYFEKIKDRARRLSGRSTKAESPKNKGKASVKTPKRSSKLQPLSEEVVKKLDLRNFGFDRSTKPKMAAVSDAINEAHYTLSDINAPGPGPQPQPETMNGQNNASHTTVVVEDEEISIRLQGAVGPVDATLQTPPLSATTPEQNVNSSTNTSTKGATQGQHDTTNYQDPENLSNSEMFKLILQTVTKNKEDFETAVSGQNRRISEIEVSNRSINSTITKLQGECNDNCKKVQVLEEKVEVLENMIIRQSAMLSESRNKEETREVFALRNNLVIHGIVEEKNESCMQVVNNFFTNIMRITDTVHVQDAHRLGKGENRPLLVKLKAPREKGKVYKNTKELKGVKNVKGKGYKIRDQLPARSQAESNRQKNIVWQNNKKDSVAEKLELSFKRGKLNVGHFPYVKAIAAPSPGDVFHATDETRARWRKLKIKPGNVILKGKCKFYGYSLVAGKLDTIREAYLSLREKHADARHIVLGYRLPGKNFALLQDGVDDDEHSAGETLLQLLCKAQIFNRAIFVVRYYGGEQLGPARFQAYAEAAQSAIAHDTYNYITKENQTPWPKDPPQWTQQQHTEAQPSDIGHTPQQAMGTTPALPPTPAPRPPLQQRTWEENGVQQELASVQHRQLNMESDMSGYYHQAYPRGRQPSGPTRPLGTLHNWHNTNPVDEEWGNYYDKNYNNSSSHPQDWESIVAKKDGRSSFTSLQADITNLTTSLQDSAH